MRCVIDAGVMLSKRDVEAWARFSIHPKASPPAIDTPADWRRVLLDAVSMCDYLCAG